MPVLLASLASVVFGTADFLGGVAARRVSALRVVLVSKAVGLPLALVAPVILPGRPAPEDLAWGVAAGLSGSVGIALLYRGLALGPMNVVAPMTALTGTAVPVLVGFGLGERPGPVALAGIVLALPAIVLVSREPPSPRVRGPRAAPGAALAVGAGVTLGLFAVLMSRPGEAAGFWPLAVAHGTQLAIFLLAVPLTAYDGQAAFPWRVAAGAGVFDVTATVLAVRALQLGLLSVVAVLISLYPVTTGVLAHRFLGERLLRHQTAGAGLALVALILLASG